MCPRQPSSPGRQSIDNSLYSFLSASEVFVLFFVQMLVNLSAQSVHSSLGNVRRGQVFLESFKSARVSSSKGGSACLVHEDDQEAGREPWCCVLLVGGHAGLELGRRMVQRTLLLSLSHNTLGQLRLDIEKAQSHVLLWRGRRRGFSLLTRTRRI